MELLDGDDSGWRQEETKVVGPAPSVARMNLAFALAVAGLAFSVALPAAYALGLTPPQK